MMANLLDREWRTAEGFPARRVSSATRMALAPTRGRMTRQPHKCPRWTPMEEDGGRAKRFQGALRQEQFLEIGVGAF